ncbi:hypothetical protein NUSPORA_00933 [Nucleospora cyclopteri]
MKTSAPWFIKYAPQKFTQLKFSNEVHLNTLKWLKNGNSKILNLHGPIGVGKTSLAKLTAKVLKFYPIEVDHNNIINISEIIKNTTTYLNNRSPLLIVDEPIISTTKILRMIKNTKIPVILTTSQLFLKGYETFKIFKPSLETVIDIAKPILKKENKIINESEIIKIAESCDFDIRSILNTLQLFLPETKIDFVKFSFSTNNFYACKQILTKNMNFSQLENFYSRTVLETCLTSFLETNKSIYKLIAVYNSISNTDLFQYDSQFISLKKFCRTTNNFVFTRDFPLEINSKDAKVQERHFYKKLMKINCAKRHLKSILLKINKKYLNEEEIEIINSTTESLEINEKKTFRYKYKKLATNSIKKDLTMKDFLI